MRVLVVDDSESIGYLVQRALEAESIDCDTASTFKEGLLKIQKADSPGNRFDIALVDLLMPDNTAKWLIDNLISTMGSHRPKIIVFSACPSAAAEAVGLRADGCILKPFALETLLDELERLAPKVSVKAPQGRSLAYGTQHPVVP